MTMEQLLYFQAICKFMNFSVAAEEVNISQSSLSKQIKALEKELSVELFSRSTRHIALTDAGREFAVHCKKIVDEYNKMLCALKDYCPAVMRSVRIASLPILNPYRITDMIDEFECLHGDIHLSIAEQDALYVLRALENHDCDMAIIRPWELPHGDYVEYPLLSDELVLLVSDAHSLCNRERISLSEAADEQFILLSADTGLYSFCIGACKKAGFFPHVLHTNIRLDTILKFVVRGTGVSLLMKKVAQYIAKPGMRILDLAEKPSLNLSILTRDEKLSSGCEEYIRFAMEYFHK